MSIERALNVGQGGSWRCSPQLRPVVQVAISTRLPPAVTLTETVYLQSCVLRVCGDSLRGPPIKIYYPLSLRWETLYGPCVTGTNPRMPDNISMNAAGRA